ncbi:cellulase family glycosylhydrolase [Halococcoides cellulosivorans]|uniref:Glycoside hydrolase family 5 domain-containing protein n=1 Tax=Halococcoides cellulosivorans TaxID=1679096 RepID=A0A2R4X3K8_9EURY|nr:cellulase family glycosylhydrolase [Halococcoides cellulosivorans]AWB28382.1 hypothetical protein HARCEL1_12035 [Halococcoides cellulosivorans]
MTHTDRTETATHRAAARTTNRRQFLKLAGAGAMTGALGTGALGSAAGLVGDPTPALHRDGNVMRDPSDNTVALHGLNVIDPRRANELAPWTKSIEDLITLATDPEEGWNAQVIRIPVHPIDVHDPADDYGELDPGEFTQAELDSYVENHLDPAVQACKDRGVYAMVDYHRHRTTDFTTPELDDEVRMFWETVAPEYAEAEHVIYELYNEPVGANRGSWGNQQAEQCMQRWRETAQPWLDIVQDNAPARPVLVGTPSWDQYTYLAPDYEFDGDNLMYAGHVYAHAGYRPLGEYFGTPADEVPVFMSEFGFDTTGSSDDFINGTVDVEGQQFQTFFEEYDHVSSTAWIMSHFWSPPMYVEQDGASNYEQLTGFGEWTQSFLESKTDVNRPGEGTPSTTPPDTTETPSWPDGATDPDGDGLYEDLSGNDDLDFPDVNTLFQNTDSQQAQANAAFYDFDGDGDVDLQDVLALFETV